MAIIMSPYDYYVYVLESPRPTEYTRFEDRKYGYVFYVGKGVGIRIHWHEEEARLGHDCAKCRLIRSLWDQGLKVKKRIVFATPDEGEAFRYEGQLIRKIGKHNLTNVHPGAPNYMSPAEKMAAHHQRMAEEAERNGE